MVKKEITARDIVLLNKRPTALTSLSERYGIPTEELEEAIGVLKKEGYGVELSGDVIYRRPVDAQSEPVDLSGRFKKH
jgi:biotin operon repressor